jgi:hypothetical protein
VFKLCSICVPFFFLFQQLFFSQINKWSLEDVELVLLMGPGGGAAEGEQQQHPLMPDALLEGAMLEGAQWVAADDAEAAAAGAGRLQLADELHCALPSLSRLRWRHKATTLAASVSADAHTHTHAHTHSGADSSMVAFPLYLSSQRTTLVHEVLVRVPADMPKQVWAQRGVAVIFQSALL